MEFLAGMWWNGDGWMDWQSVSMGRFFISILSIILFFFGCFILIETGKFWHFKVALNIFCSAFRLARDSFVFWVSGMLVLSTSLLDYLIVHHYHLGCILLGY